MKTIDTRELASRLAGGDYYIRTKDGEVKGLAVTIRDNPEAPEVIIVGNKPKVISRAEQFMESGKAVPLYIKQGANAWAYRGEYRPTAFSRDAAVIEDYRKHRSTESIAGILFLEEVDGSADFQGRGGWSTDPETRKAVEEAAVLRVMTYLEHLNPPFEVRDRQKDNCGYDLLAIRGKEALRVEVKGTAGTKPAFCLTRNERAASVHPAWLLAVVTDALSDEPSEPLFFTADEMNSRFDLEPYGWRATPKAQ
ncbi:protein of unknown function [Billgrantia gudaonensis]|uniref:Protein NO VEIN C-terminal domain-containing protein n=2 Tax=Billgrantia gudaonensis TaxID=376427 RepID=A0A1G8Y6E4_9GAMM|nr:protein of unknown function [Halomonas gudaonensis]